MRGIRVITALAVVSLGVSPSAFAQDTGAFVVKLGRDTLSLEQFTRTPTQVRGEYITRSPRTSHRTYTMDLNPDGTVSRFELIVRNLGAGAGPAELRSTVEFHGDSATWTAPRGDSTVTRRVAAGRGAAPTLFGVMGLIDQLTRQARAAGGSIAGVPLVQPGSASTMTGAVKSAGGDTMMFTAQTQVGLIGPWVLKVDNQGRLQHYDGTGTAFQGVAERVPAVDLAAARAAYTDRPLGALSQRDTTRFEIGGGQAWIDYGRPAKRGREVFGTVVPWEQVWRLGANAATQFHTPVDVTLGGATVPAGTYTLWVVPSPKSWKLIVNKQTGQWGTVHQPEQDLVRVDMKVESLPQPVEVLTIEHVTAGGGALQVSWDRTRATVPLKAK